MVSLGDHAMCWRVAPVIFTGGFTLLHCRRDAIDAERLISEFPTLPRIIRRSTGQRLLAWNV
jgi:hypothetical protein